jgi:hypothetical protein
MDGREGQMWVVIIFGVIVMLVWFVIGGIGSTPIVSACDTCRTEVEAWWRGLSKGQKALKLAYYWARRADCALRC